MGEIKHVSIETPIETILEILDEDAGVIIDNFLSDQNLESIKNDLKPYLNVTRNCLLYTSPSPRDLSTSRMPSSA